jgi:hypothetical protein
VVLPNDKQLLARSAIVVPRKIVERVIVDVETVQNGEAHRARSLDDTAAHCRNLVITDAIVKRACRSVSGASGE